MSVYICSDLHGQYTLFMKMLDRINFSENDTLYILGDIIDRGPKSIKLLKYIMSQDNIICTIGNHEYMMLNFHSGRNFRESMVWLHPNNGGDKTQKQFSRLTKKEQEEILDYLNNLYLQIEVTENNKKFLLSHSSYIIDKDTIKWKDASKDEVERVVWYSPWRTWEYESFSHYQWDNRTHIIGHVPVQAVLYNENYKLSDEENLKQSNKLKERIEHNVINLDGGCSFKSKKLFTNCGIICMNLSIYSHNKKDDAFYYIK